MVRTDKRTKTQTAASSLEADNSKKQAPSLTPPGPQAGPGAGLIPPADAERPARRQVGPEHALVRLERAPSWNVRVPRRVVRQHRDHPADRHVADLRGQHDDRNRALAPQRVDRHQRRRPRRHLARHPGAGRGRPRGLGDRRGQRRGKRGSGVRLRARAPGPLLPASEPRPAHAITLTMSIVPVVANRYAKEHAKRRYDRAPWPIGPRTPRTPGVPCNRVKARDTVSTTRCRRPWTGA